MHACDIIAWCADGAIYCPDCARESGLDDDKDNDEVSPVFADHEEETIGSTCDTCGACYVDPDGWRAKSDLDDVRWALCGSCGHVKPTVAPTAQERLTALRGELRCSFCTKGELHF